MSLRTASLLLAALGLSLTTALAAPADAQRAAPPGSAPGLRVDLGHAGEQLLPRGGRGRAVVEELGDRLPEAAAVNDLSSGELRDILTEDRTTSLGRDGQLAYAEPAPSAAEVAAHAQADAEAQVAAEGITVPSTVDAFALHSQPLGSRAHTIYLDFDGIALPSTSWWVTSSNPKMTATTYGGINLEGTAGTYSELERAYIVKIWQIVSERYAPFDVDVTTEDPGSGAYNRTSVSDQTWGDHVVFTPDTAPRTQVCGSCAGVALMGNFDAVDNGALEPVWVFTSATGSSAGLAAYVATHEVGHTLGLAHDGVTGSSYYNGGSGNWVPVMGIANWHALQQFSKGDYLLATNTEDDLAAIAAGGAPLKPDDHPNNSAAPEPLGALPATVDGVVANALDDDTFSLTTSCAGTLTATATGIGSGTSLDLRVDILNAAGSSVLATDDPASGQASDPTDSGIRLPTGVNSAASYAAPAATYRIRVDGTGSGNKLSGGYDDYGSIGQYRLVVNGCGGTSTGNVPSAPTAPAASPNTRTRTGTITWGTPTTDGGSAITGYTVSGVPSGPHVITNPAARSQAVSGLVPGQTYPVSIVARNAKGPSTAATTSITVPTWSEVGAPSITTTTSGTSATIRWTASTSNPGNAAGAGWSLRLLRSGAVVYSNPNLASNVTQITLSPVSIGSYTVELRQRTTSSEGAGTSALGTRAFSVAVRPSAPRIGTASTGAAGRPVNATIRWSAPTSTGGAPLSGYRVYAYKLNAKNQIIATRASTLRPITARSYVWALASGRYRFRVVTYNRIGSSPFSAYSRIVTAR